MKNALLLAFALLYTSVAQADWATYGVAIKCSPRGDKFELAPVIEVSNGNSGAIGVEKGYRRLKDGSNHLECAIGGRSVRAEVVVLSYGDHQCQGAGQIVISSLSIDGRHIYKDQNFNWFCNSSTPTPFRIAITSANDKVVVKECNATDWYYGEGYKNRQCAQREP